METTFPKDGARWELYRLLGEPLRLRLLGLVSEDELSVGELAELLDESQPNVSKHIAALRRANLVTIRKQGTRAFVTLDDGTRGDPVGADAVRSGRAMCEADGSLVRVAEVVRKRDAAGREFFAKSPPELPLDALPPELLVYLSALAPLFRDRELAVDVGTGDGRLLDVLAPIFEHVIAVDRAEPQLERAKQRAASRGFTNVELLRAEPDEATLRKRVQRDGGADLVLASRMLHHASRPERTLSALAALLRPTGALLVIDYVAHEDERLREHQADVWLGFAPDELARLATRAGLKDVSVRELPSAFVSPLRGPDAHLRWQCLVARRDDTPRATKARARTH